MTSLSRRSWVPKESEDFVQELARTTSNQPTDAVALRLDELISANQRIHDLECVNLNPATNTLNPAAAAALGAGLSSRTSLGYPLAKYEMGLEAIEQIEVIAAELAAEVFAAEYVEFRVPSGAMANLYSFMACTQPGDSIIVPPASIAGHVTHHSPGAAGLYGLEIHEAPIRAEDYTFDIDGLRQLASQVEPRMISVGSSLNLSHHDVAAIREVADAVGAVVLFDAAHLSGLIAGGAWPNPLAQGAHIMTMSTYKSLGGPTAGLLVTNDAAIAERVDAIAFPGLTANFDVGKTAALAITLLDWRDHGSAYADTMVDCAQGLAAALEARGVSVFQTTSGPTQSHAFAVDVRSHGGGQHVARHLRKANLLTSAIGLPGDLDAALRVGLNELVRWGAKPDDMDPLAELVANALAADDPESLANEASSYRGKFDRLHFLRTD